MRILSRRLLLAITLPVMSLSATAALADSSISEVRSTQTQPSATAPEQPSGAESARAQYRAERVHHRVRRH